MILHTNFDIFNLLGSKYSELLQRQGCLTVRHNIKVQKGHTKVTVELVQDFDVWIFIAPTELKLKQHIHDIGLSKTPGCSLLI